MIATPKSRRHPAGSARLARLEGVFERHGCRTVRKPPVGAAGLDHPGVRGPVDLGVLDESGQHQAGVQHGLDDLAEAVVPLVADGFRERFAVGVGVGLLEPRRLGAARSTGTSARAGPDRSRRSPRAPDAPRAGRGGRRDGAARRPSPPSGGCRAASRARRCRCTRGRSARCRAPRARRRARPRRTRRRGPCRAARSRPTASAPGEKSRPVTRAPRRASDTVSVPMWHCRCATSSPVRSPRWGASQTTTSLRRSGSFTSRSSA